MTIDSGPVSDVAGNVAEGIKAGPFQIDLSDPVIDIKDAPEEGATVDVCEGEPAPSFSAQDTLSGIATTNDPGVLTKPETTSGAGSYTYEARATDKAGNASSVTRSYKVGYDSAYSNVLEPINLGDQRSVFKLGSTVPVKFKLTCANQPITDAVAKLSVQKVDGTVEGPVNEAVSTSAAATGNLFRYDETSQQYVFNLSTKGSFDGNTGTFEESEEDGTLDTVRISASVGTITQSATRFGTWSWSYATPEVAADETKTVTITATDSRGASSRTSFSLTVKDVKRIIPPRNGKIAYSGFDGTDYEIYTVDPNGGTPVKVTNNTTDEIDPSYSPNGTRIAYSGSDGTHYAIYTINASGGTPFNVTNSLAGEFDTSYSPDGNKIARAPSALCPGSA